MTLSLDDVLRNAFASSSGIRVDFVHPKLRIEAKRKDSKKGTPIQLGEIWFWINPKRIITEEEVHAAISLFHPPSEYQGGGLDYYTETRSVEKALPLEEIPSFYAGNREKLRNIADEPPRASINGNLLDGPVKVPSHRWSIVYAAFEKPENNDPKFGHTWNSVVLYKDAMKLRIAKPANYLYNISPALVEVLDKLQTKSDAECDLAIRNVVPVIAKHEGITSEADVFKRMFAAPQPVIKREEVEAIANYIETMIGSDPVTLDYKIESPF